MPARQDSNFDDFDRSLSGIGDKFAFYARGTVEAINRESLDYAKSFTARTVPGIRKSEGARATHPGGWADRAGIMVISFYHQENQITPAIFEGVLGNSTEYAEYVEALGYWVVTGLFEGTIQQISDKHMRAFAEFITRGL